MELECKSMTMEERKQKLSGLVEKFENNEKFYTSKGFKEASCRQEFIDELLVCLGWDVKNLKGARHDKQEVTIEDNVIINGNVKHPDYTLRYGGLPKFYVEAKQPSIDLQKNPEPALQVRRYAYSSGLPIAVLTDFQELAIYDTRIKTKNPTHFCIGFFPKYEHKTLLKLLDVGIAVLLHSYQQVIVVLIVALLIACLLKCFYFRVCLYLNREFCAVVKCYTILFHIFSFRDSIHWTNFWHNF